MSGEHTHDDQGWADAALVEAAIKSLSDRLSRLTAQVVVLEAAAGPQDVFDYDYLGKPPRPQVIGRTWTRLELSAHQPARPGWEHTLVYLNITPTFQGGKLAGALRPRLVRANGDYSMYDDVLVHADALDGDGVSCRNRLYWEAGDGGATHLELRCIGGLASVQLGTRYRKVATVKDRG